MLKRQEIMAAHDAVSRIPDEIQVSREQVEAITVVLGLLAALLDRLQGDGPNGTRESS